jgi:hypothetical protein
VIALELTEHFCSRDVRQMKVEEHEVGTVRADEIQSGPPPRCRDQQHTGKVLEGPFDDLEVGRVVLYVDNCAPA